MPATKPRRNKRQKKPDVSKMYQRTAAPVDLSTQEFRAQLFRADTKGPPLNIDGLITSLEWRALPGDPVLQGTLALQVPDIGPKPAISEGHVLQLSVLWSSKWREVWRMRLYDQAKTISDIQTFELADPGRILQESVDTWHFTKNKARKKGWRCHEIVREVARRYRIPLGKIAAGKHYITDIHGEMSPMQVIQKAYAIERRNTGKRFVIRWQNGRLNIVPMRRNPLMYTLSNLIEDATIARDPRDEKFATAVTVRASVKKSGGGRKREKIVVRYINKKAVAKDGFIHRNLSGGDVKTRADAERKAKRYIAKHSKRDRTIQNIQHRGIAFVRRGDGIRVSLPREGFYGKRGIAYISAGTWRISGGDFTMSLDLTVADPYQTAKTKRKEKDKKTRAAKRKKK